MGRSVALLVLGLSVACSDPDGGDADTGVGPADSAMGGDADAAPTDGDPPTDAGAVGLQIPAQGEWTDHGEIFGAGSDGEWDLYLWGGFAGTALTHDGTIYLYYQGADGYDDVDDTVTYRAVGVATSTDGRTFAKHADNPVLRWWPTDHLEEGAVSSAGYVAADGSVRLYYGANTAFAATQVNADVRIADSGDGLTFTDRGVLLDHADPDVWAYGDELFPLTAFTTGDSRFVYYVPNGTMAGDQLGVAWGPEDGAVDTAPVRLDSGPVTGWGMCGAARLADDRYAVFVSNVRNSPRDVTVYVVDPARPDRFTMVDRYVFAQASAATVMFDAERETWFLFYRTAMADAYGMMTAGAVWR